MMTPLDASNIAELVGERLRTLGGGSLSRGLDELAPEARQPSDLRSCVSCFCALVAHLRARGEDRTICWAISLPPTQELKTTPYPADSELECDFWSKLYLIAGPFELSEAQEEYRSRITGACADAGVFRSWRSVEEAAKDWEFNNCIFLVDPASRTVSAVR